MVNPLENYYRSKEVYVKLPSGGNYYKQKPKMINGEIGVMPMTTRDEMLLKVPDTLYNGEALFEIVASVCPDIPDPYEVCMADLDAILLASRVATYGEDLEVEARCPNCNTNGQYSINVPALMASIKPLSTLTEIEIDSLKIKLKPNTLAVITANGQKAYDQALVQRAMEQHPENYKEMFKETIERIAASNIALTADCIESVTTPNGEVVTSFEQIVAWLSNTNTRVYDTVNKHSKVFNESGLQKVFHFTCSDESCGKEFDAPFEFNASFFFSQS